MFGMVPSIKALASAQARLLKLLVARVPQEEPFRQEAEKLIIQMDDAMSKLGIKNQGE